MNALAMHPMLHNLLPEVWIVVGASVILLLGSLTGRAAWAFGLALLTLAAALWSAHDLHHAPAAAVAGINQDSLVWYARSVIIVLGLLILLVNRHVPVEGERAEFFALILFSLCGLTCVALANDLIFLFLALELVSVPTYILVGLSRRDIRAQEATGKYFFLGAFAAALTLYGFSFLYGAAGTTQILSTAGHPSSIAAALSAPSVAGDRLTILGLLLAMAGLAFKLAAFPLHFYVADVYQGAASPVAGLLGFVPKFAGFLAMVRLLSAVGWEYSDALFWLLWVMAAATMTVGNTLALMQHNVKRMLAYSGVAHSGYMLLGLAAGPLAASSVGAEGSPLRNGLAAVFFYLPLYGVMNLGAFAALSFFRRDGADGEEDSVEDMHDLSGAGRAHPWAALALAVCTFGLMGMPPTGGFLGKLYLFSSGLALTPGGSAGWRHTAMIVLVVIGAVNAAVAMAYYLRIVASAFMGQPAEGVRPSECRALRLGLFFCAGIVLAVFLRPAALFERSLDAVAHVGRPPAFSLPGSASASNPPAHP